jgi:hypothetical protein
VFGAGIDRFVQEQQQNAAMEALGKGKKIIGKTAGGVVGGFTTAGALRSGMVLVSKVVGIKASMSLQHSTRCCAFLHTVSYRHQGDNTLLICMRSALRLQAPASLQALARRAASCLLARAPALQEQVRRRQQQQQQQQQQHMAVTQRSRTVAECAALEACYQDCTSRSSNSLGVFGSHQLGGYKLSFTLQRLWCAASCVVLLHSGSQDLSCKSLESMSDTNAMLADVLPAEPVPAPLDLPATPDAAMYEGPVGGNKHSSDAIAAMDSTPDSLAMTASSEGVISPNGSIGGAEKKKEKSSFKKLFKSKTKHEA